MPVMTSPSREEQSLQEKVGATLLVKVVVDQSCLTLCDPMDYIAHQVPLSMGILQVRMLEWVAIFFSRGSSTPRDQTWVSHIVGRCFPI